MEILHDDFDGRLNKSQLYSVGSFPYYRSDCIFPSTTKNETAEEKSCRKIDRTNKRNELLPGLFLTVCWHGMVVDASLMEKGESPRYAFQTLRRRFVRAPPVVVYDLACAAHKYSMTRDPHFFHRTRFLLDRLHVYNHHACAPTYRPSQHPDLKGVNTQVSEQFNAILRPFKSFLQYATYRHFTLALTFFLRFHNRRKAAALRQKMAA